MGLGGSRALLSVGVAAGLLAATTPLHAEDSYPLFAGVGLDTGRAVWLDNCRGCHADGTADAPRPSHYAEWAPRITQPRDVLYRHAIEGFFGPDYSMMPARGGNEELSDTEVMAAVDYMLRLVEHFRQVSE
jgi:cytochrome c5